MPGFNLDSTALGPFTRALLERIGEARSAYEQAPVLGQTSSRVPGLSDVNDALGRANYALSGGALDPSVQTASLLERLGVPGHDTLGGQVGPFEFGPRELAGLAAGMVNPRGLVSRAASPGERAALDWAAGYIPRAKTGAIAVRGGESALPKGGTAPLDPAGAPLRQGQAASTGQLPPQEPAPPLPQAPNRTAPETVLPERPQAPPAGSAEPIAGPNIEPTPYRGLDKGTTGSTNFRELPDLKSKIAEIEQRLQAITSAGDNGLLSDPNAAIPVVQDGLVVNPETGRRVDPAEVVRSLTSDVNGLYGMLRASGRRYAGERVRQLNPELEHPDASFLDPSEYLSNLLVERHYKTGMVSDLQQAFRSRFGGQDSNQAFDKAVPDENTKLRLPGGLEIPAEAFFPEGKPVDRYSQLSPEAQNFVAEHMGHTFATHPEYADVRLGPDDFAAGVSRMREGRVNYLQNQVDQGRGEYPYSYKDSQGRRLPPGTSIPEGTNLSVYREGVSPATHDEMGRPVPASQTEDSVRQQAALNRIIDAYLGVKSNTERFLSPAARQRDALYEGMGQKFRSETNTRFPKRANEADTARDTNEQLRNDIAAHESDVRDNTPGEPTYLGQGETGNDALRAAQAPAVTRFQRQPIGPNGEMLDVQVGKGTGVPTRVSGEGPALTSEDALVPNANPDKPTSRLSTPATMPGTGDFADLQNLRVPPEIERFMDLILRLENRRLPQVSPAEWEARMRRP